MYHFKNSLKRVNDSNYIFQNSTYLVYSHVLFVRWLSRGAWRTVVVGWPILLFATGGGRFIRSDGPHEATHFARLSSNNLLLYISVSPVV